MRVIIDIIAGQAFTPPAALVRPKLHNTRRSMRPFKSQKRSAVPMGAGSTQRNCQSGIDLNTRTGVSRLPIPNPVTAEMAPATMPTTMTKASEHVDVISAGYARDGTAVSFR